MLFNSYIFILFFLPCTLIAYYLLNHIRRGIMANIVLVVMSLWFYAYFHVSYLAVIAGSILFNYLLSVLLLRCGSSGRSVLTGWILAGGILGNIAVIFYFKYFNFFLENVNALTHSSFQPKNILMPLGISFFTFQQISYLVDSRRGETKDYSFLDYCLFVTFFPQLIAGPIVTHEEMIPQFRDGSRKRFDQEYFARGLYCFAVGLGKKVLLADALGLGADWGFAHPGELTALDTVLVSLLYTFQLYFDFSGYCDMAYGIAKMFHIDLPVNFDSPYKALSVADFWRRWHMTLGRFFRKYLYFPLGGSKRGKFRTALNGMVVFLVSGLWHGANWTFVLWGGLHGAANVFYRLFRKLWDRFPKAVRWAVQFVFLDIGWMLFRSDSVADFGIMMKNLVTKDWNVVSSQLSASFDILEFTYLREHIAVLGKLTARIPWLPPAALLGLAAVIALLKENACRRSRNMELTLPGALWCVVLLVWSVISLSGVTTFLYFNF